MICAPELMLLESAMPKFQVSYAIAGDTARRAIIFKHASATVAIQAVARAIIKHEFPDNPDDPFPEEENPTAGKVLARFGITDLKTPSVIDDEKTGGTKGGQCARKQLYLC
jgi:hypothetical protein